MSYDTYTSPLASRNASKQMLELWSPRHKFNTWRRIWLAVAEAQHELGLPVTKEQVEELRTVVTRPGGITDDEMKAAEKYERELRHDVMAHVHALGDSCPKAKGIIHLGMTSQDVVCNSDLLIISKSIELIELKISRALLSLGMQAVQWKSTPTLGFTHYQPAQPVTVGRRIAGWASELQIVLQETGHDPFLHSRWTGVHRLRGLRGATGTQASFHSLFSGNDALVDQLEARVVMRLRDQEDEVQRLFDKERVTQRREEEIQFYQRALSDPTQSARHAAHREGLEVSQRPVEEQISSMAASCASDHCWTLSNQTYPRVIDAIVLSRLACTAAVLHKIATDIRLLSNRKELDEPFESKQIGSSAMPYKRNPMRCERICGLTRFVMNLVGNAYDTAATQWLERTLDDSSNRRLSLPEAFLALDGALDLMHNVASGLIVHEAMVRKNLMAELPFMATENILMACVKLGGDRQEYHELIRQHAQAAGLRVKQEGLDNDLLERLQADKHFWSTKRGGPLREELDWAGVMDPMKYVGRSVEQTQRFIKEVVGPLREQYKDQLAALEDNAPRV
ncbi:MAG TPA: lyase family protein [Phycisphaerales bacterium]|nr:lyase family protein [Phycisphaerales bacterium]